MKGIYLIEVIMDPKGIKPHRAPITPSGHSVSAEPIDDVIFGWSSTISLTDNNEIEIIHEQTVSDDKDFFNTIIRHSMDSLKKADYFDNVSWHIINLEKNHLSFLLWFYERSISLDRIIADFEANMRLNRKRVLGIKTTELETKEYIEKAQEARRRGFADCSTAWTSEADRYEYIHELYSERDD